MMRFFGGVGYLTRNSGLDFGSDRDGVTIRVPEF